jgi:hypothetical protein
MFILVMDKQQKYRFLSKVNNPTVISSKMQMISITVVRNNFTLPLITEKAKSKSLFDTEL